MHNNGSAVRAGNATTTLAATTDQMRARTWASLELSSTLDEFINWLADQRDAQGWEAGR